MITDKYQFSQLLSQGSFGKVYKARNLRTNLYVALKIENHPQNSLIHEARIYNFLRFIPGFNTFRLFFSDEENNYLVTNLLGIDLLSFKKKHYTVSMIMIKNIGEQMIQRLNTLHSKGLLHRDIKPSNFLFGLKDPHVLYLIDFGFCKRFMFGKNHIEFKKTSDIIGTINFISLNVHKCYEPSRRDDLESVIYVLLYLLDLTTWNNGSISKVIEEKEKILYSSIPFYLREMLKHVRELEFDETPKYALLIHLLHQMT